MFKWRFSFLLSVFKLQGGSNFESLCNILECDYFKVSCAAFCFQSSLSLQNEISSLELKKKEILQTEMPYLGIP